jgi:putative peptidoglycan lipid II flippase
MWYGTRRIVTASVCAAFVGWGARLVHQSVLSAWHVRLVALPVLAAFGVTYLVVAWWMGSAEAARWLRRPVRSSARG